MEDILTSLFGGDLGKLVVGWFCGAWAVLHIAGRYEKERQRLREEARLHGVLPQRVDWRDLRNDIFIGLLPTALMLMLLIWPPTPEGPP